MASVESSGTLTTVVGTSEQNLASPAGTGAVVTRLLEVDLGTLVNGDTIEVRVKKALLNGGTVREVQLNSFTNVVVPAIQPTIPVISDTGATFTVKQTTGAARSVPWKVFVL